MLKYILICILACLFCACSGKVQTNPEPNTNKYNLPNSEIRLTSKVSQEILEDYEQFIQEFFKIDRADFKKSIWTIGIERGHYE